MARKTLLDHAPIPSRNVHQVHGESDPPEAALAYEDKLRESFSADAQQVGPRFDLVLLGMGADGHTASLFPGTPALHETKGWVVSHYVDAVGAWRVTLTAPAINAAAQVTFVVSGAEKAETIHDALRGPYQPELCRCKPSSPAPVILPGCWTRMRGIPL